MASAEDIKNLMLAYEIVGNDLDQRCCKKVANITDKVMYRISKNSTWQNVGDALQNTVIDPAVAAGQTAMNAANAVGQTASNAANAVGQFAQDWLSPQALATKSAQFLQEQLNKAIDATVKQKLTAELQRRGIQPSASQTATPTPESQNAMISKVLDWAKKVHSLPYNGADSVHDGWGVINDAIRDNTVLTPASKQSLKQQWAQLAETLPKQPPASAKPKPAGPAPSATATPPTNV